MLQARKVAPSVVFIGVLGMCTGFALHPKARQLDNCNTHAVQQCLSGATEMVPDLYFRPLNADLLFDITDSLCGRRLENCMAKMEGNCSKNALAPFATIVSTINYVCASDISNHEDCITNQDSQRGFRFCFQLFKVVFDNAISDVSLSNTEIKAAVCSAYDDVTSCVAEVAEKPCGAAGTTYVENLVKAASSANREVLECS